MVNTTNIRPGNKERLKRSIPVPEAMPAGYRYMLKKEARVTPASVTFRHELLLRQKRANYINEFDRLNGEIESYANTFNRPGSSHIMSVLKNRQVELKRLFRESHHENSHPTTQK